MSHENYIKNHYHYSHKTGLLWKMCRKYSKIAGCQKQNGYMAVNILKTTYLSHRVCWFLHYGKFPENEIDHVDRNGFNNKIDNLREATRQQNAVNRTKLSNNTSGFKGVFWRKSRATWIAVISFNHKTTYIGSYSSPEEASIAYENKAKELHGQFYCKEDFCEPVNAD